jgi:lipoyl synthase
MPPDPDEPRRVAQAAAEMQLQYVVVTSVTRDDLPDGGASQFAATIQALREAIADVRVEVLIPDFQGDRNALTIVLDAKPDVSQSQCRDRAAMLPRGATPGPVRTLAASAAKCGRPERPHIPTKSGLMLGLGETDAEVRHLLADLRRVRVRILTLGQYLQPTPNHHPVTRYVRPEAFERWRLTALDMGFDQVAGGPFVRSSYRAGDVFRGLKD